MTNETKEHDIQWSTTLSEEAIRLAPEGSHAAQLKKPIGEFGASRTEWARQATNKCPPRLLIGGEMIAYQDNFADVLQQKIQVKYPNVPVSAIEFLINNGAQGGFGWYGLNYFARVTQEQFGVNFELTRDDSTQDDDVTYEISAEKDALLMTVTVKNINTFSYLDEPFQKFNFENGASITSKARFKIQLNGEQQPEFKCVSYQDTFLNHEWALHQSRASLLASMPIPTKNPKLTTVAKLKYDYLKQVSDFIAQHQPEIDAGFKTNIKRICHELKQISPDITRVLAIKNLNNALNPGLFTRLFRWIAAKFKRTPGNTTVVPVSRTGTLSRIASVLRRKRVETPETPAAPKPKFRERVKGLVNAVKKIRFRGFRRKKAVKQEEKAEQPVVSVH